MHDICATRLTQAPFEHDIEAIPGGIDSGQIANDLTIIDDLDRDIALLKCVEPELLLDTQA